jgi:hypothetical protein
VKELAQYAQYAVLNRRVAVSVRTAATEWRRRRAAVSKRLTIPPPQAGRAIGMPSIRLPLVLLGDGGAPGSPIRWEVAESDPETLWSVHRFGWMLERLAASPTRATARASLDTVRDWTNHRASRHFPVLDSYSVSERLANWSFVALLLSRARDNAAIADDGIRASVDHQAARLIESLEDHGAGYTNNHLLNNLRALFWYGTVWNAPEHRHSATKLAGDALPRLFTPCGFLRESSSHYHLLLTRSLLEMRLLAEMAEDQEAIELLQPWAERTSSAAAFLLAGGRLPLIGDVAPDFTPDWVLGLMTVASRVAELPTSDCVCAPGWHTLWVGEAPTRTAPRHEGWSAFPDAGWYRMTKGTVDLLWHLNPDGAVGPRSHGHVDLGSFELVWSGQPIVVDPGRPTYAASSWDARRGASHNTITIDGYDPMLAWGVNGYPTAMDRRYWDPRASLAATNGRVTLRHHGFERLARGLVVERQFTLSNRRLDIVDIVERAEGRVVDSFLHLAPDVAVRRLGPLDLELVAPSVTVVARWTCNDSDRVHFDLMSAQAGPEAAGWFSPRYGEQVPTTTIRLRAICRGDYRTHVTIAEGSA